MEHYWQDSMRTVYNKSCLDMSEVPDGSIQCVVTSPPYWRLRKYAGEQDLIWGGSNHHEHEWTIAIPDSIERPSYRRDKKAGVNRRNIPVNSCNICGAWRGAYGLEPTPAMYVQHTVDILRGIRRVLRKDGVVFWNVGDSYNGNNAGWIGNHSTLQGGQRTQINAQDRPVKRAPSLKHKDLCLIPFRVAIAAQEDGWYVRSIIIWNKTNPMPESVKDRPTAAYEHIIMLTKSRHYYWDMEAVREPWKPNEYDKFRAMDGGFRYRGKHKDGYDKNVSRDDHLNTNCTGQPIGDPLRGRNLRNVWTFPTQPYPAAHFATFPEELPERCIKAATPERGCCPVCGKPWERVMEKGLTAHDGNTASLYGKETTANRLAVLRQAARERGGEYLNEARTVEWKPGCQCGGEPVPALVLDPFAGSGTTLAVAARLGRKSIGYELSEEYCRLIIDRNKQGVFI